MFFFGKIFTQNWSKSYFVFLPLITIPSFPEGVPPAKQNYLQLDLALFTVLRKNIARYHDVDNMAIHNYLL